MDRLFVALRPPTAMRAQLLAMAGHVSGARWQSDAQLHLTLAFLGDVDAATAERVDAALGMIDAPPVTLTLLGVGHFAARGRVHSLWAGVAPDAALLRLAGKVRRAARQVGVALEERAFAPHITLARLNASSGPIDEFVGRWSDLASEPVHLSQFGLYESRMGHGGSAYHCLSHYALRGAG